MKNIYEMIEIEQITHISSELNILVADYNIEVIDEYLLQYDLSLLYDQSILAILLVTNRIKHVLKNRDIVHEYLLKNNKFVDSKTIQWIDNLK